MSTKRRRMRLGCFCPPPGHHLAAWRMDGVDAAASFKLEHCIDLVNKVESAAFDFFFLSDGAGIRTHYSSLESLSKWGRVVQFEPLTLMAALAMHTKNIGLVATTSTTYNEPFNIARSLASLDLLSQGRIGWNIVTSVTDAEAQNFNLERMPSHDVRYARAHECLEVVTGLWRSWDSDAFVQNKRDGVFFDPLKARLLNYKGQFFNVRGPLNVSPSPQSHPVLVQAGSSETGRDFASKWAEVMFTVQDDIENAIAFRKDMRSRVSNSGRDANAVKILPGVLCVVGHSDEDAKSRLESMQFLVPESAAREQLRSQLGDVEINLDDLDSPVPAIASTQGSRSKQELILRHARTNGLSLRQLMNQISIGRGHLVLVGSGKTIAGQMTEWFEAGAVDGFNVMPTHTPEGLDMFISEVMPHLRLSGYVQQDYAFKTFRENLERNFV